MIITNCPRCGAMNATTTCTKCGWSQFAQVTTVSTGVLLDDYKRLLLENRNLNARIAELEAERDDWRKSYINLWRHINNLPQPPEVQE
jgi:endonuclease YncB( thermonuclease family)